MRLLVTGSRNWVNSAVIKKALRLFAAEQNVTVVHGAAIGADLIADTWAEAFGMETETHPSNLYRSQGSKPRALVRNDAMLDSLDPERDMVLAFMLGTPERGGTKYTVDGAKARGLRVIIFNWPGDPDYKEERVK